ncbi:hypothetical protein ACHAXS_008413 [Conticribra weissflogii]
MTNIPHPPKTPSKIGNPFISCHTPNFRSSEPQTTEIALPSNTNQHKHQHQRPSHRSPPIPRTPPPKTGKKSLHGRMPKHPPDHRNVLQTRRRNREELSEQIDQSIDLRHHPDHGPSHQDQGDAAEEGEYSSETISSGEEAEGAMNADGEGEAGEEEYVAEGEEGGVEEEEDAEEEEGEAQEH